MRELCGGRKRKGKEGKRRKEITCGALYRSAAASLCAREMKLRSVVESVGLSISIPPPERSFLEFRLSVRGGGGGGSAK